MARRCRNNRCSYPRANWWKQALGVDYYSQGGGETDNWILATGVWRDEGVWQDDDVWQDS